MRGLNATQSGTATTEPGRKRNPDIEPACLRTDVFDELTLRALTRANKNKSQKVRATERTRAELLELDPGTVNRLRRRGYEPTLGTALHIARILGTKVEKLWGPASEVCPADVDEVA